MSKLNVTNLEEPETELYVPDGQFWHEEEEMAPIVVENVPTLQGVHAASELAPKIPEKDPCGQETQKIELHNYFAKIIIP